MAPMLSRQHDLSYYDPAALAGIAGDLHVCQVVNPLYSVKVIVPYDLLPLP